MKPMWSIPNLETPKPAAKSAADIAANAIARAVLSSPTSDLEKRIETIDLLKKLQVGDEGPGSTILRALRANADLSAFAERLAVVFAPNGHWNGPAIRKIIRVEYEAVLQGEQNDGAKGP